LTPCRFDKEKKLALKYFFSSFSYQLDFFIKRCKSNGSTNHGEWGVVHRMLKQLRLDGHQLIYYYLLAHEYWLSSNKQKIILVIFQLFVPCDKEKKNQIFFSLWFSQGGNFVNISNIIFLLAVKYHRINYRLSKYFGTRLCTRLLQTWKTNLVTNWVETHLRMHRNWRSW